MAELIIQGKLSRSDTGAGLAGETVRLKKGSTTVDSDVTDSGGNYFVSTTTGGTGTYHSEFLGNSPHFAAKDGPNHFFEDSVDEQFTDNLSSTFSNNNPTLGAVGNISETQNTGSHNHDVTINDADSGDVLTLVKNSGPAWFTVSTPDSSPPGTGRRTVNTNGVSPNTYSASVKVTDNFSGVSTIKNFSIIIASDNNPPVLTNPGTQNYQNNSGIQELQLVATDGDNDPITFSKVSGPTAVVIPSNGLMATDTDAATRGSPTVVARASDGEANDDESFTVNILNNAPVFDSTPNIRLEVNTGVQRFTVTATDQDNDTLTFSKFSGDVNIVVNSDGTVDVDTDAISGVFPLVVDVDDGNGGTDQAAFDVDVFTPAPAPEVHIIG